MLKHHAFKSVHEGCLGPERGASVNLLQVWCLDFPLSDNFTKHEKYEK